MSNASLELGGDNWAAKDGNLLGYAVGDSSGKYVPREFTFTRGSNLAATRVAANGLIEKGRENLLINSVWDGVTTDTKPTGWSNQFVLGTGTFDVTATEGQIRFQTLDASSRAFIYSPTITTNGIVVASVYVDEVTTAIPLSNLLSRSANATDLFAYEDGVEINYSDNVQAGKRYSVVFNKTGSTEFRIGVGTSGSVLGDVVLSRPQVEVGLVATEWITSPVGSTGLAGLLEDEPRIDYTGGTGSLLLEPSRTNLISQSEYFTALNSGSVVVNDSLSPEGLQNANKIIFGAIVNDGATMNLSASCSGNTQYTWSAYVKNISGTGVFNLRIDTDTTIILVNQDITATSEWTRVSHTFTTDASATSFGSNSRYRSEADGNEILIWGAQLEQGSYVTSYIPNHSGGSVTRGAEGQSYAGLSSLIGQTEGTLLLEIDSSSNNTEIFSLNRSTANAIFLRAVSNVYGVYTYADGATYIVNTSISINDKIKIAIAYESGNFAIYANGSQVSTNNSNWTPNVLIDTLNFNVGGYISSKGKVNFNKVLLFPTALSDAQCSALTVEGLKEEILTSYIAAVDTLEDGAEARLDTYLQNLEDLIV